MTAQEKAKELIERYKPFVCGYVGSSMLTNTEYPDQILSQAKAVAKTVVDEIANLHSLKVGRKISVSSQDTLFWKNVKQEIDAYTE